MAADDPSEENKDKTAESESQMDTFHHSLWTKRETGEGINQHVLIFLKYQEINHSKHRD